MDEKNMKHASDKMWQALANQDNVSLAAALVAAADPNCLAPNGLHPVMLACVSADAEAVALLASSGASFPPTAYAHTITFFSDALAATHEPDDLVHASLVAIDTGNAALVRALMSLKGAAAMFAPDSSLSLQVMPERTRGPIPAHFLERYPDYLVDVGMLATVDTERGLPNLNEREAQILREVLATFLVPLHTRALDPEMRDEMALASSTALVRDRQAADGSVPGAVRALSFSMLGRHGALSASDIASTFAVDQVDRSDLSIGLVQISSNAYVKIAVENSSYGGEADNFGYDEADDLSFFDPPVEETSDCSVSGTIFYSDSPEALARYIHSIGNLGADICLYRALCNDDYSATKAAVLAGADTTLSAAGGRCADIVAAGFDDGNSLRALVESDPLTKYRLTKTAFELESPMVAAVSHNSEAMGRLLIEKFFKKVPVATRFHASPEIESASLAILLAAGANPNAVDGRGCRPLDVACLSKAPGLVAPLVSAGAVPNFRSKAGLPLINVCQKGGIESVKALLDGGADPNEVHENGTALSYVCREGDPRLIGALLDAGADPNLQSADGLPLLIAAKRGLVEGVTTLLRSGANPVLALNEIERTGQAADVSPDMVALLHAWRAQQAVQAAAGRFRPAPRS